MGEKNTLDTFGLQVIVKDPFDLPNYDDFKELYRAQHKGRNPEGQAILDWKAKHPQEWAERQRQREEREKKPYRGWDL